MTFILHKYLSVWAVGIWGEPRWTRLLISHIHFISDNLHSSKLFLKCVNVIDIIVGNFWVWWPTHSVTVTMKFEPCAYVSNLSVFWFYNSHKYNLTTIVASSTHTCHCTSITFFVLLSRRVSHHCRTCWTSKSKGP